MREQSMAERVIEEALPGLTDPVGDGRADHVHLGETGPVVRVESGDQR